MLIRIIIICLVFISVKIETLLGQQSHSIIIENTGNNTPSGDYDTYLSILILLVLILSITLACFIYRSNLALSKCAKDLNKINLSVQSVGLIRWNINLLTNINSFINIDNSEHIYTNNQLLKRIHADDYSKLRSLISQIKQDKYIDPITIKINLFGDKTHKSYDVTATLVRNEDGSPSYSYGLLKDVSELCRSQKLLNRAIYLNKTIWKSIRNCVYFYNPTGLCKDVNNSGLSHFGFTKDQVVDNFNLFSHSHISEESKDALRNGASISYQISYTDMIFDICNDYTIMDNMRDELFSVNCSPVFGYDNELIGYIAVYSDISEITQSRKEIHELDAKLALCISMENISVWTYNFDHDTYKVIGNKNLFVMPKTLSELFEATSLEDIKIITNAYEAIQTRKSIKETFTVRVKIDGRTQYIRSIITYLELEGETQHIIGVSKNISEEVKTKIDLIEVNAMLDNQNKELNLKNLLFKEIIDQIPGLLFIKDISDNHKYCIVNNQFCKLIANNSPMDQVVGCSDYDYFPKEVADEFYLGDLACIKNNKPFEIDEKLILNGCSSTWRTLKAPVTLANNEKMLICLSLEVTEIYHLKNKAQESDALKSQFLANMSHELRTPLNAIVGFSNLLMDVDDCETKKEFNEIIATNSELLLNLVNDILDLSKIESGVVSFDDEYVNINELLDEIYLTFNMRTQPNVTLRCEKLDENWWIEIDKLKFNQILNNFLSNAIKYTPSGEIVFGCVIERKGIRMYVKDTGIGITDEKKEKVFGRFEKLDTFAQGTGLGLSICKALVGLKKGEIGFESTLGEGSYFWVWIPCNVYIN